MILHFDDLFTIDENKVIRTKKQISIDGRQFAPNTSLELEVIRIGCYELSDLQGKLLQTSISQHAIEIHSIGEDIVD
jgi:hypothetical protein